MIYIKQKSSENSKYSWKDKLYYLHTLLVGLLFGKSYF